MAFFYNFSHEEMLNMEAATFYSYYKAINSIEAQNALMDLTVASYPHMKNKDRMEVKKKLKKEAYPIKDGPVMTSEEAAKEIQRMLNGGR